MKILAATNNTHKIHEIRSILSPHGIEVICLADLNREYPKIVEDGATFNENACIKARAIAEYTDLPVIADDSGLEVFALNGEPGIFSARYAGESASDIENTQKLLKEMHNIENRAARFVCCIAIAYPDGGIKTIEGEVRGRIMREPSGTGGFGYDPVFVPDSYNETFADLGAEIKDCISHRGNALKNALKQKLFKNI